MTAEQAYESPQRNKKAGNLRLFVSYRSLEGVWGDFCKSFPSVSPISSLYSLGTMVLGFMMPLGSRAFLRAFMTTKELPCSSGIHWVRYLPLPW